jgi:hypothetical protein
MLPAWCGWAQESKVKFVNEKDLEYPPLLPAGKTSLREESPDFLKATTELNAGVTIAKTPPTIDFLFYPGQNYPGKPWSNWGDGLATGGKYYSSIGDHLAADNKGDHPHGTGTAFVYEYDPEKRSFRELVNLAATLQLPSGHYTPGKIHGRLDMGSDGNLYFSTHRGSTRVTTDQYHYEGDWIFRCDPNTQTTEMVVRGPVPKHCIPNSVVDPQRMIFYGGTAPGSGDASDIRFFAYDLQKKQMLYEGANGPARYMIFAPSTGRVYYVSGAGTGPLMRYDPQSGKPPVAIGEANLRAASQETSDGFVYAVSQGQGQNDSQIWSLNTRTEEIKAIGSAPVGSQSYIASLDVDPTGRFLYYVAGAHGGSERDGTPVVQFNVRTGERKVIAFLHPYFQQQYGLIMKGTYGSAIDPQGDKLYITFNVSRGTKAWDCCGLVVVHIPATER